VTDSPGRPTATAERDAVASIWARTRASSVSSRWSLKRRLALTFTVAGILLVVGCVVGGLALVSMVKAVNLQVNRLDPALRYSSDLYSSYINQETGVRGYALTKGQKAFLVPYTQGVRSAARNKKLLIQLAAPYPKLRADLNTAIAKADQWSSAYAVPAIATVQNGGTVSDATEVIGKNDFDAFRNAVNAFNAEATDERRSALSRLHDATDTTVIVAASGALLLLLGGVAAWTGMTLWVRRPLESVRRETQTVASGDLNHRVQISGPREFSELAADVEAMRRQLIYSLDDVSFKAAELERSNRDLEQFAYVASHDLQEPLRKVASFCQMLENRYAEQLDERAKQYIAYAVDGAKRMQGLINDLLAFSRVGQPGTSFGPVDLNEAAGRAVSELEAAVEDSDAMITVDRLPTVPGERGLLIQLFANLIGNSIKFRRVDVPPVIRITAEQKNGEWEFACKDNGIGIEPSYRERVFVIFQRLHPRDAYPGTGIGLALCRKIVDFHGGKIWIDDQQTDQPGTVIRWTLPSSITRQGGRDGA
jgi:signal transduction histidine kinase